MCGKCCRTKYLCLYPHEVDKATKLAQKKGIELNLTPLKIRIDFKNKVILDIIYRATQRPCPFFVNNECIIHEERFIACRKYPFSNWTKSPELFVKFLKFPEYFFEIDIKCTAMQQYYKEKNKLPDESFFKEEFTAFKKDMEIYDKIEQRLKELNESNVIELRKENKFKSKNPEKYHEIINNWKHIKFDNY